MSDPNSIDTKPSMPAQPTTKTFPKVEVPQTTLEALVTEMRGCREDLRKMGGDLNLVIGEVDVVKGALQNIQEWRDIVDERLKTNSLRAKEPSTHDIEAKAQIAKTEARLDSVEQKVTSIETKTDAQTRMLSDNNAMTLAIKTELVGFFQSPKVRFVGRVVWVTAMGYAAARGLKVLP